VLSFFLGRAGGLVEDHNVVGGTILSSA
jgi:hypothetical protein